MIVSSRLIVPLVLYLCWCNRVVLSQEDGSLESFKNIGELISYYSKSYDLEGLNRQLSALFEETQRNIQPSKRKRAPLSAFNDGGSGYELTTRHKLAHDLEQFEYLRNYPGIGFTPNTARVLKEEIPKDYHAILDLFENGTIQSDAFYRFKPGDPVLDWYNRALFVPQMDAKLKSDEQYGNKLEVPLLNPANDFAQLERQWFGEDPNHPDPGIVVVDNLLSPEALKKVRELLLLSTFWYESKSPETAGRYVGAYIGDGLHQKLILAIAYDLHKAMPRVMEGHPLKFMWAYKYESDVLANDDGGDNDNSTRVEESTGVLTHADDAAVNVNIWITPDEANLDPDSGGLVVFKTKPPEDWSFREYNAQAEYVEEHLLKPSGFANVTVPYKQNRAVIFDSLLFHRTDQHRFKPGYENRRINLTILYGNHGRNNDKKQKKKKANDEL